MKGKKSISLLCAALLACNMTVNAAPFDPVYYAAANPDVATALGNDAAALELHYHSFGAAEGRMANAEEAARNQQKEPVSFEEFDAAYYAANNPDVVAAFGSEPEALYNHYLLCGAAEGRTANAEEAAQRKARKPVSFEEFDAAYYAANNPDVVAVLGSEPKALYAHYLLCGAAEGRLPKTPKVTTQKPAPVVSSDDSDNSDSSDSSNDSDSSESPQGSESSQTSQSSVTHTLSYTSNSDGTHAITCSVEGCTEAAHSGTGICNEVNGSCEHCHQQFSKLTHTLTYTYNDNSSHYCKCSLEGCHLTGHNTTAGCNLKYSYDSVTNNGTHSVTCSECQEIIESNQACNKQCISVGNSEHKDQCTYCKHSSNFRNHTYDDAKHCSACGHDCTHEFDYGNSVNCMICGWECPHTNWGNEEPGRCDLCQYPHSSDTACTDEDKDGKCDICKADISNS